MAVVQSELQRINQRLNPAVSNGFQRGAALVDLSGVMRDVPVLSASDLFFYFSQLPPVREWKNGRVFHDLATRAFRKLTKKWDLSFKVDEDQLEDALQNPDTSGAFNIWAEAAGQIGFRYAQHRYNLYATMLNDLLTENWDVDGQDFYDSDHPINPDNAGGSTFSNRFDTSTGVARPLTHANADDVWTRFNAITDENNEPMVLGEIVAEVPNALATKAQQIWKDATIVPGVAVGANAANYIQPNPNFGRVSRVIVNKWLDVNSTTRWYYHCIGGMVPPFFWLNRRSVRTREFTAASEMAAQDGEYKFMTDARYAPAAMFPHMTCTADV
jgi:phage major head subunit gpT-like protein